MRIRSVKPEFFDSPSTAQCSPWGRLLYIAMWCMADDWGVGSANLKEMAANAFPNDDQWTSKELPSLCKEVADAFQVTFYTNRGRPYFQIPSWEDHQVTQRRAKRRFPTLEDPNSVLDQAIHDLPCIDQELPSRSKENASTEQGKGNRGTGEQGNSSSQVASDPRPDEPAPEPRPDVEELLDLLDAEIEANGNRPPSRTKTNRDSVRLLIDRDEYTPEQIRYVIGWCQQDNFWKANILSPKKLREKFPQLVARIKSEQERPSERGPARNRADERGDESRTVIENLRRIEEQQATTIQGELL